MDVIDSEEGIIYQWYTYLAIETWLLCVVVQISYPCPPLFLDLSKAIEILDEVKNLRGLGLQLGLQRSKLNELDEISNFTGRRLSFFYLWCDHCTDNCSWTALIKALLAPQLRLERLANKAEKLLVERAESFQKCLLSLRKQSSADSALGTPSPNSAPTILLPQGKKWLLENGPESPKDH